MNEPSTPSAANPKPVGGLLNILLQNSSNKKRQSPFVKNSKYTQSKQNNEDYSRALNSLDPAAAEVIDAKNDEQAKKKDYSLVRKKYNAQRRRMRHAGKSSPPIFKNILKSLSSKTATIIFNNLDILVNIFQCILYIYEIETSVPAAVFPKWLFSTRPRWLWMVLVSCSFYDITSFSSDFPKLSP